MKAKMSGSERDVFSRRARKIICMSRHFRKWVKAHFNRRTRHALKVSDRLSDA